MKRENLVLLEKMIKRKSMEFGVCRIRRPSGIIHIAAPREQFHFMTELVCPVVPALPLQMSIQDEGDTMRALLFPSPRILAAQIAERSLILTNEANRELYRGSALGRFWVDLENLDFAYELMIKETMLENGVEEIGRQLFDVPLAHFRDLHIPLAMLAGGTWDCDTALRYFQQLRREGYVDNRDYGLW